MRRIGLIAVFVAGVTGFARSGEPDCVQAHGRDVQPPREVVRALDNAGLVGYQLIDKADCRNTIYWLAIPPDIAPDQPRPPGFGRLVLFDAGTGKVDIMKGQ